MNDPISKTIDSDTYLKALALATMSNDLYVRCREIQLHLAKMIGLKDGSHVDDEIYSDTKMTVSDFDQALKHAGITVEASTTLLDGVPDA